MLLLSGIDRSAVTRLAAEFGMDLRVVPTGEHIPGSYWGECEAGLRGNTLFARLDTPLHSILHELAHYICMSPERRVGLDREAGGDDAEESAVCYLQILLADLLARVGRARLWADMDEWGYSFRLGSTRSWFQQDAQDSCAWLRVHGIIDAAAQVTGTLRERA
jgi:hypothetical protein